MYAAASTARSAVTATRRRIHTLIRERARLRPARRERGALRGSRPASAAVRVDIRRAPSPRATRRRRAPGLRARGYAEPVVNASPALRHHGEDVGRRRVAGVLDEVGVHLGESRPAPPEAATSGRLEELPGRAPLGAWIAGIGEGRAEGLDPRRLGLAALVAHARQRRLDLRGIALDEPERRARDDLPGPRSERRYRNPSSSGPAHRPTRRAHVDPLERARELAAVRVRVHLHGAAHRARDVDPELEPRQPPSGGLCRRRRQPGPAATQHAHAVARDCRQLAVELDCKAAKSIVRHQQVRSRADHSYPDPLGVGPPQ